MAVVSGLYQTDRVEFSNGVHFGISTNLVTGGVVMLKTSQYNMKLTKKTMQSLGKSISARIVIQVIKEGVDVDGNKMEPRSNKTIGKSQVDLVRTGKLLSKIKVRISKYSDDGTWWFNVEPNAKATHSVVNDLKFEDLTFRVKKGRREFNYGNVIMFGRNPGKRAVKYGLALLHDEERGDSYQAVATRFRKYPGIPRRLWCGFSPETAQEFLDGDLLPVLDSLCFQLSLIPFKLYEYGTEYIGTATESESNGIEKQWKNANVLSKQAKALIKANKKDTSIFTLKKVL